MVVLAKTSNKLIRIRGFHIDYLGHAHHFTIENLPARLSRLKQDPWADIAKTKQSITAAMLKRIAAR
jgi:DNA primase